MQYESGQQIEIRIIGRIIGKPMMHPATGELIYQLLDQNDELFFSCDKYMHKPRTREFIIFE